MAIDSRNKRDSAIGLSLPWRGRLPAPNSAIDAADRLHIALRYSGIAAGEAVVRSFVCASIRIYPRLGGNATVRPALAGQARIVKC